MIELKKQMAMRFIIWGVVFLLGMILGCYNHEWIRSSIASLLRLTPKVVHYCPSPSIVKNHQYHSGAFEENHLSWQMMYQLWESSQEISFMQALIKDNDSLVCYYNWPNPQNKENYLWLTVQLSPEANQAVQPAGLHWSKEQDNDTPLFKCAGGIHTCAFSLSPEKSF
ncbi:MAG: hypothetical protein CK423_07080 [Legionella sp.]|nr:MAG: hypothetical protein CK423_07080 [Legionella sp.]